jgi:hypothetical protein
VCNQAIYTVAITLLMKEKFPDASKPELCSKICETVEKSRRRILGILILMKSVNHLHQFINESIWDADLPFQRISLKEFTTRAGQHSTKNTTLFQDWERNKIDLFYCYQKMFIVPFFNIKPDILCSYNLGGDIRLPWKEYQAKSKGGWGLVFQLQIPPSHHNFIGNQVGLGFKFLRFPEVSLTSNSQSRNLYILLSKKSTRWIEKLTKQNSVP